LIIYKTKEEAKARLQKESIRPAHLLRLKGYGSLIFECSCGETHNINEKHISCRSSAKPFKALLKCKNNYITMIKIEGFFKKKAISEYGFDAVIMEK
tara:strand:- start:86 stop:376 length:291 start_codon:yes stop_codon:yes gene_type:complete